MKILFVTPSYKPAYCYGGPTISVSELAEALVKIGHSVTVYTTTANGKTELEVPVGKTTMIGGVEVYYFKRITKDHTHVSPDLWWKLWKTIKQFDIIHLQSWWSFLILGSALICKFSKRDYIVSPRGMLGAYSFKNQHNLFKKLIHRLIGKRLLESSILHATTLLEWNDCKQVYSQWKGFIAHNLISLPVIQKTIYQYKKQSIFTIGFLSRIDPKKGIELLLQALANVTFEYKLKIAGSGDERYIADLKALASKLGIADKIEWCGWINVEEKFRFFQSIDLFALTSFNENFAIAVTESLATGTAVLVSEMVGLADYVREKGLGWVCKTEIQSIQNKLTDIYFNKNALAGVKSAAPLIIKKDFNKEELAQKYIAAYQSTLGVMN